MSLKIQRSSVKPTTLGLIIVRRRPDTVDRGWLQAGQRRFACALGRSGLTQAKREGDGATPVTAMALRRLWWRPDRIARPRTPLTLRAIKPRDGWCDAPGDRNYNRHVTRPYPVSHEIMWRDDALYDLVVELGWNDAPRRQGRGSAIFMHIARHGLKPTEGCVVLTPGDMRRLLEVVGARTRLVVRG